MSTVYDHARALEKRIEKLKVTKAFLESELALVKSTSEGRRKELLRLENQIEELADFIVANVPGEPRAGGGAIDVAIRWMKEMLGKPSAPIPMLLFCPSCGGRHVDRGEFAHKPHHTHACQHCGIVWRPAIVATVGVSFLPGFKDGQNVAPIEEP